LVATAIEPGPKDTLSKHSSAAMIYVLQNLATEPPHDGKQFMITIHHLNFSRSTRVIWLLEELQLPYTLVKYERDANFRAPSSLKAVHPLGKAPVMVDDGFVLAESSAILTYINDQLGGGRFAPKAGTQKRFIHDEWLQYVESSAAFPIMMTLISSRLGGLSEGLQRFAEPEVTGTLGYISSALAKGPYIMGDGFTIADIQFAFPLEAARNAGLLDDYAVLRNYLARLAERPAYIKAIEIGGPMVRPKA
jgi:glutathione S-transferase